MPYLDDWFLSTSIVYFFRKNLKSIAGISDERFCCAPNRTRFDLAILSEIWSSLECRWRRRSSPGCSPLQTWLLLLAGPPRRVHSKSSSQTCKFLCIQPRFQSCRSNSSHVAAHWQQNLLTFLGRFSMAELGMEGSKSWAYQWSL